MTEPSPHATTIWFSCASDQEVSYIESWESKLECISTDPMSRYVKKLSRKDTYNFWDTMPLAVSSRMYNRPFPTNPKFAEAATAMRESKKGEYFTA